MVEIRINKRSTEGVLARESASWRGQLQRATFLLSVSYTCFLSLLMLTQFFHSTTWHFLDPLANPWDTKVRHNPVAPVKVIEHECDHRKPCRASFPCGFPTRTAAADGAVRAGLHGRGVRGLPLPAQQPDGRAAARGRGLPHAARLLDPHRADPASQFQTPEPCVQGLDRSICCDKSL